LTLEETNRFQHTFLVSAVHNKRDEIAKYLIGERADITATNKNKGNILRIAAERKNGDFIKYLFEHDKISINENEAGKIYLGAVDKFGDTAVVIAGKVNAPEVVDLIEDLSAKLTEQFEHTEHQSDTIENDFTPPDENSDVNKEDSQEFTIVDPIVSIMGGVDQYSDVV